MPNREPRDTGGDTGEHAAVHGIAEYDTGVHVTPVPRSASPLEHLHREVRVEEFRREKSDRDLRRRGDRLEHDIGDLRQRAERTDRELEARFAQINQTLANLSLEISQWNVHIFGFKDQGKGRFGQLEEQIVSQASRIEEHARLFKAQSETVEKLGRLQFKIVVAASLAGSAVAVVISVVEWILTH